MSVRIITKAGGRFYVHKIHGSSANPEQIEHRFPQSDCELLPGDPRQVEMFSLRTDPDHIMEVELVASLVNGSIRNGCWDSGSPIDDWLFRSTKRGHFYRAYFTDISIVR